MLLAKFREKCLISWENDKKTHLCVKKVFHNYFNKKIKKRTKIKCKNILFQLVAQGNISHFFYLSWSMENGKFNKNFHNI